MSKFAQVGIIGPDGYSHWVWADTYSPRQWKVIRAFQRLGIWKLWEFRAERRRDAEAAKRAEEQRQRDLRAEVPDEHGIEQWQYLREQIEADRARYCGEDYVGPWTGHWYPSGR
jgi:hypothetical protein